LLYLVAMTTQSIRTIDPGSVARQAAHRATKSSVVGSGIDVRHSNFARYANLTLPPGLQHYDLTLLRNRVDDPFHRDQPAVFARPATLDYENDVGSSAV
jgi:hypothetical protein